MRQPRSRRSLLASVGAGAVLAPFVPVLARAADVRPRRLVFFFSSNGTVRDRWLPTMSGGQLVLSEILKPLEPHKSDLLVIDGLGYNIPGWQGHETGMVLTGARGQKPDGKNSWALGPSIDQHIANAIGASTKFRTLELGVQTNGAGTWNSALSYRESMQPLRAENSPWRAFDRIFAGLVPPAPSGADPLAEVRRDRKSVIDFVTADLGALAPRLGTAERRKVELHLESIREIERTLAAGKGAAAGATCAAPAMGKALDVSANANVPALGRLQMDILVMALACDLVRVGTIQHGSAGSYFVMTWVLPEQATNKYANAKGDGTYGFHGIAHNEGDPVARGKLVLCHQWFAGELAYLLGKCKAVPEGAGTMADGTLAVWMNELGTGSHSFKNTPWVLAGSAGGALKTGRVLSFPGQPHNRILVSICQAMGLSGTTTFGDPQQGGGPLTGLTA